MQPCASANRARRKALFLAVLMCSALLPLVAPAVSADDGRAISVQLTAIPTALEVNPGESGEYTIRVRNNGDNPITVQLGTAEEAGGDCGAYTSTITQITGPIDAGSYEEAAMNITLTQAAEGSCKTTVTANINEQVTPPDVADPPPKRRLKSPRRPVTVLAALCLVLTSSSPRTSEAKSGKANKSWITRSR